MKLLCDICGEELTELGALVFSPPIGGGQVSTYDGYSVIKYHICVGCWDKVHDDLFTEAV